MPSQWGNRVEEIKSLKIRADLHEELSVRADQLGMKLGRFCEALLAAGLRLDDDAILDELKLLAKKNR